MRQNSPGAGPLCDRAEAAGVLCGWQAIPRLQPSPPGRPRTISQIKGENAKCDFSRDRDLPILVVDDQSVVAPCVLHRYPWQIAALPWVEQSGAFLVI